MRERPCWVPLRGCKPSDVVIGLRPDPPGSRVVGISARSASTTADFNPGRDLVLRLVTPTRSDSLSGNLWSIDPSDVRELERRTIEAGGQAQLRIEFDTRIPPGDHVAKIQLTGLNTSPEGSPVLDLSAEVRLLPLYAWLVLALAVVFSYIATKGVGTLNARGSLMRRIRAIRSNRWLFGRDWPALPMVEAEATVAVVEAMLEKERGWVKSIVVPKAQAGRISEVEKLIPSLEKLNQLASFWGLAPPQDGPVSDAPDIVRRRAHKALRKIIADFSRDEEGAGVTTSLAQLQRWEQHDALEDLYWQDLKADIRRICEEFRVDEFALPLSDERALQAELEKQRNQASNSGAQSAAALFRTALDKLENIEDAGSGPVREALDAIHSAGIPLAEADDALRKIETSDREVVRSLLGLLKPKEEPDGLRLMIEQEEAYSKLKLIWEHRREAALLQKLLAVEREGLPVDAFFDPVDKLTWARLSAATNGSGPPARKQGQGNVEEESGGVVASLANVKIVCRPRGGGKNAKAYDLISFMWEKENRTLTSPVLDIDVDPSEKVLAGSAYGRSEVLVTLLALVVAVVGGAQTEAFDQALAGSLGDLGVLFAWGIGTDQVKNLLQTLTTYSGEGEV